MSRKNGLFCKLELYKLFKRKDVWLLYTMILVPALYAIGLASDSDVISYTGTGNITAINFVSAMFQMSQSMFIFNVIMVAIAGRTLGTEIEEKSLLLYLNRVGERKKVYIGKVKALSIYSILITVLLLISSLIFYYLVLCNRADIANGSWSDKNSFMEIVQILTNCMFWIMTMLFGLYLSSYFKVTVCLGIYMILYIAMNLLSYVKVVGYLSPLYYISKFTIENKFTPSDMIICILYFTSVTCVVSYCGSLNLEKKDL